jgi:hypothetical protein
MTKTKTHTEVQGATSPGKSQYLRKLIKDTAPGSIIIDPRPAESWSISPFAPPLEIQPALTALADQLAELKDSLSSDDRRHIRLEIEKLVKTHLNL